jgi:hypothetical protein
VKQNFYNPLYHNGTQPIRVLAPNILHWFQNADKDFLTEILSEINNNGLKKSINYIDGENKISHIAYVDENKEITIEETFLAYLWTISYSLIVLFDEVIMRPRVEENYQLTKADIDRVNEAQQIFDYGLSLVKSFTKWDINNLPNPEYYDPAQNSYIEKANGIFLAAVNFVLVHEFAHVFLGHIDFDNHLYDQGLVPTKKDIKDGEYAADDYSFKTLMSGADYIANKSTVSTGIITGLCSLLFFSASTDGDDHPDPGERIKIALDNLGLDEKDNLWGIASLAFKLWATHYKIDLDWPPIVDTYKDLLTLTLSKITK